MMDQVDNKIMQADRLRSTHYTGIYILFTNTYVDRQVAR